MTQKIIQIGNSTGIIIPKNLLEELDLQLGSEVTLEKDETTKTLTIAKVGQNTKATLITPEFFAILDMVNKNYGDALRELAKR